MGALLALMEDESERTLWRMYMAQIGEALARGMGYEVVPYVQIIGKGQPMDTRTGDEIADDLLARMSGYAGKEE